MKLHENWLIKARSELRSSKKLIKGDDPIFDTSIYHTQQCAEKGLKAYLAFKEQPIEKTHDIEFLVELCSEYDPEFKNLIEEAEKINPYSILYRYPNIVLEPEVQQVHEAIEIAEKMLKFVEKKIEAEQDGREEKENEG
jgi:HEPN domain-containing protein